MNINTAIENINKIGHAGVITALVLRIVMIIAASFVLLGGIALLALPKDFIKLTTKSAFSVNVDFSSINVTVPADKFEQIKDSVETKGYIQYDSETGSVTGSFSNVDITPDHLSTGADFTTSKINLRDCAAVLFIAFVYIACAIVTTIFFGNLFKSLWACASPFAEDVIRNMRNLAFSLIPWTVISMFSSTAVKALFSPEGNIRIDVTLNLTMVVLILIILALTYIFKYGAILQTESDETL